MTMRMLITVWSLAVAIGMLALFGYSATPGRAAAAPARWPDTTLELDPTRPTLLMVVHPQCSCSRASLGELSRLMAELRHDVTPYVIFSTPPDTPVAWTDSDLHELAGLVPDVRIVHDPGRHIAERFDAHTSGQTYLYAPTGHLLFAGGITPTRAHMGNSVGRQRILSLVAEGTSDRSSSAVYGCPIEEE